MYVPFSVGSVRAALAERERVAGCVPGLQLDASGASGASGSGSGSGSGGAAPAASGAGGDVVEGRLRVRIGGSSITYRGRLTLVPTGDGFTAEGTGSEARGDGSVALSLTVVPRPSEDAEGTRLVCSGTVTAGESAGRLAEFEEKTVTSAGQRLLDRFGAALAESIRERAPEGSGSGAEVAEAAGGIGEPDDNERAIPGIPGPETGDAEAASGAEDEASDEAGDDAHEVRGGERASVFETDVPPPSLDPLEDDEDDGDDGDDPATAEAAHARRTMIGRSAEEVDHAPPRGRYAPVPAPEPAAATATLRWAAPAAAVVVAGAVVLGRALRRRR
ncbi:SRPBCC domain-containing protein [Streptomyces daliensis]